MAISSTIPSQQTNLHSSPRSHNLPPNRPTHQQQRSRSNIRPLHHYTISELKANLFKNEQFLKSSDRVNSLPDKGAKLIEANSKIREVVRLKLECEARGVPYPGTGTDLGPDQFPSMKNKHYGSQMGGVSDMGQQFEKMILTNGSLSSASLSSSFSRSESTESLTPPGPSPVSSRESLPKRSPRPPVHSGSPNSLKQPNHRQHQRTYSDSPHSSSGKHKKSGSVPSSTKLEPKSVDDSEAPKPAQSSLSPGLLQFLQIQKGLQMEREKRLKEEEEGKIDPVKQPSSKGNLVQASTASNSPRSSTQKLPISKRPVFQYFDDFLDEDSDDFDGFSEEEYY